MAEKLVAHHVNAYFGQPRALHDIYLAFRPTC